MMIVEAHAMRTAENDAAAGERQDREGAAELLHSETCSLLLATEAICPQRFPASGGAILPMLAPEWTANRMTFARELVRRVELFFASRPVQRLIEDKGLHEEKRLHEDKSPR